MFPLKDSLPLFSALVPYMLHWIYSDDMRLWMGQLQDAGRWVDASTLAAANLIGSDHGRYASIMYLCVVYGKTNLFYLMFSHRIC